MRIRKYINTTVDLFTSTDIYSADLDTLLLSKLEQRYVGKCFASMYITGIVGILRRSSINLVNDRLDGAAYVDVNFEVEGVILINGEILHNCNIIEKHTNAITAEHEYASIKLKKPSDSRVYDVLSPKINIPIVIEAVSYILNQKTISVLAYPYTPKATPNDFYYVTSEISPADAEKLSFIYDKITEEEKLHTAISDKKEYTFFKELMYPFKTTQKFDQSPAVKQLGLQKKQFTMETLIAMEPGYVVYPDEEHFLSKSLYHAGKTMDENKEIIMSDPFAVYGGILNKYLFNLQALRGFVETYPTFNDIKKMSSYWKICHMTKS